MSPSFSTVDSVHRDHVTLEPEFLLSATHVLKEWGNTSFMSSELFTARPVGACPTSQEKLLIGTKGTTRNSVLNAILRLLLHCFVKYFAKRPLNLMPVICFC